MSAIPTLWQFRGLVGHLIQRELKLRYRRSVLGWLWSLITPAATLGTYILVFGIFLRVHPPPSLNGNVDSFAIFLFIGLVVWNLFSFIVTQSMNWLINAGPLLRKVYLPPAAPVVAGALAALVQTGTEFGILIVILGLLSNLGIVPLLILPFVIALLLLFALGLALVVSLLNVYFRDINHVVSIGMTLLFFTTPIVYPLEIVPETVWGGFPIRTIIIFNPLTQFVGVSRDLLYHVSVPGWERIIVLPVASMLSFLIGWLFFHRFGTRLSEEL